MTIKHDDISRVKQVLYVYFDVHYLELALTSLLDLNLSNKSAVETFRRLRDSVRKDTHSK